MIVIWIQMEPWRWREEGQFKVSLEVKLTELENLETEDKKHSNLKAYSSISGLNGWVNGSAHC